MFVIWSHSFYGELINKVAICTAHDFHNILVGSQINCDMQLRILPMCMCDQYAVSYQTADTSLEWR